MLVVGIDPGITGGIAVLNDGKFVEGFDMPQQDKGKPQRKRNKAGVMVTRQKKEIDPWALHKILDYISDDIHIFIEQVSAGAFGQGKDGEQRTQGVVSAFGFGDSFGVIRGVCASIVGRENLHLVRPQEWKKLRGLVGCDKDVARKSAIVWYGDAASYLGRKKDIGRADAIMIADYGHHYLTRLTDDSLPALTKRLTEGK